MAAMYLSHKGTLLRACADLVAENDHFLVFTPRLPTALAFMAPS
jgi:hypothetical protein